MLRTRQIGVSDVCKSLLAVIFASAAAEAQSLTNRVTDANSHFWFVYAGDHGVRGRWGLMPELQIRRSEFAASWQQLLLRNALSYQISPSVQVAAGYGFIWTDRYGEYPFPRDFPEHRAYQQVIFKHQAGKLDLIHRYRLEQRWLKAFPSGDDSFWRYQNRFRYQIIGAVPFTKTDRNGRQWYAFGGSELFLHFGANYGASLFDQNRAFAGIGHKINPANRLEVSYVNQFLVQRSGFVQESNHTFRIQVTSTMRWFGER